MRLGLAWPRLTFIPAPLLKGQESPKHPKNSSRPSQPQVSCLSRARLGDVFHDGVSLHRSAPLAWARDLNCSVDLPQLLLSSYVASFVTEP